MENFVETHLCNLRVITFVWADQARDYRGALEQAELTGRPVRFVRWGYELPFLSLEELSRRNVYRFASTGR